MSAQAELYGTPNRTLGYTAKSTLGYLADIDVGAEGFCVRLYLTPRNQ